jgi:acetyltransferase-like isoleucine patch superfamily enzyme
MRVPILSTIVLRLEYKRKNVRIWRPANIYPTVKFGRNISVGRFSEIGHNVEIGDNTRIGAMCFIPESVKIGKNCFVGPHVCMTNDRFPPSHKWQWETTIIEDNVAIGAGCVIRCGVTIKSGSLIGAGSIVTMDIPGDEIWCGHPCRFLRSRHDIFEHTVEKYDEIVEERPIRKISEK